MLILGIACSESKSGHVTNITFYLQQLLANCLQYHLSLINSLEYGYTFCKDHEADIEL